MKKGFLIIATLLFVFAVQAQKGKISVGGGFAYGTEIERLGVDIRGYYGITEEITAAPSFTYFFPQKEEFLTSEFKLTVWEFNLDGHYTFLNEETFAVYGLAGLNIAGVTVKSEYDSYDWMSGNTTRVKDKNTDTEIGLNIGAGGQYNVNEQIGIFGEAKYVISDFDQLVLTFGIIYGLK